MIVIVLRRKQMAYIWSKYVIFFKFQTLHQKLKYKELTRECKLVKKKYVLFRKHFDKNWNIKNKIKSIYGPICNTMHLLWQKH